MGSGEQYYSFESPSSGTALSIRTLNGSFAVDENTRAEELTIPVDGFTKAGGYNVRVIFSGLDANGHTLYVSDESNAFITPQDYPATGGDIKVTDDGSEHGTDFNFGGTGATVVGDSPVLAEGEKLGGYEISSLTCYVNGEKVIGAVPLGAEESGLRLYLFHDGAGRMLRVQTKSVTAAHTFRFTLNETAAGAKYFVMGSSSSPI